MIGVVGAGAFGTALAVALCRDGKPVTLMARRADHASDMQAKRQNKRLPGVVLPGNLTVTAAMADIAGFDTVLLALPTQSLATMLKTHRAPLSGKALVACCKGIDVTTGIGPAALIAQIVPDATAAILSGPSFATDVGAGLPTALTLATQQDDDAAGLQLRLSTPSLRLYRTTDVAGVEIGGALKNVVAIASGAVIGAGLGESARGALITRGFAEMARFAASRGADPATLSGLSGLGDLALTAMSEKSRNYRFGLRLGSGQTDQTETTEGIATAHAVAALARDEGIDMPLACAVSDILNGTAALGDVITDLLRRPLKPE